MTALRSCSGAVERVLSGALRRARPHMELGADAVPSGLGVRRSAQSNADYQTSLCLQLASRSREPPVQLAQDVVAQIEASSGDDGRPAVVKDAFVSAKGFVNVVLDDAWIAQHAVMMATEGVTPSPVVKGQSKRILVDFAAPNLGKKLHVGHLRSSVIGDTLCNLLEYRGHQVARVSHTGDVGSALATLIVELMEQNVPLDTLTDAELGKYYESGKSKIPTDAAFKAKVDDVVLQLQRLGADADSSAALANGKHVVLDPRVRQVWERACQVSREAYAQIFGRLNVNVQERGESTYLPLVPATVEALKASGLAVESRGALGIFVDGPDKPPMLIQKQDGGYLYATVDLACLHSRIHGFPGVDATPYDEVIYVTDQSQQLHFQQLFAAAKLAGWTTPEGREPVVLKHAAFGLVLGKNGTKLSSRHGAFDYLADLLDATTAECRSRSLAGSGNDPSQDQSIGDAAVRYFELSQQRERSYKFLFDNVLHLKGNTGVYLLYASARLQGILRNVLAAPGTTPHGEQQWADFLRGPDALPCLLASSSDWHPSERALALLLCQFDDEVASALAQLYPHYLCDYLFRVVSHFHAFYEHCRVVQDPKQDSRIVLCAATDAVLRRGLHLVGIQPVDRM